MADFLKLLIYELKSLDGNAGTALRVRNVLLKQELRNLKKQNGGQPANEQQKKLLRAKIDHQMMHEAHLKYLFIKIKMKISFTAFVRQETIVELWLKQILKTHKYLSDTNQVFTEQRTKEEDKVMAKIMEGNIKYCLEIIMKAQMKKQKT